jgi:formate dehydrogenase subunit gamma
MIRPLLAALLALGLAAGAVQAQAPSPGRLPVSAEEMELQRALQGGRIEGRVSIPDGRAASLIQPQGKAWRDFHNTTLAWIGGVAILGVLAGLVVFFLGKGRIPIAGGASGRTITRFNLLERANHWMVASCFIVLGLSGLNLTFGRHLLLPLLGPEAFAALSNWGKVAHNFLAFPFTLGVVVMLLLWAKDNIPDRRDIDWLKLGGGFFGRGHPAAGRFNAGQKGVFWLTVIGGGLVAASGYMLIFPFAMTDIAGMQLAHMVHGALAVLMVAAMLAHIYIGSIGMEGAIDAMASGQVDLNWAKEHHGLWVDEVRRGHKPALSPGVRAAGGD